MKIPEDIVGGNRSSVIRLLLFLTSLEKQKSYAYPQEQRGFWRREEHKYCEINYVFA